MLLFICVLLYVIYFLYLNEIFNNVFNNLYFHSFIQFVQYYVNLLRAHYLQGFRCYIKSDSISVASSYGMVTAVQSIYNNLFSVIFIYNFFINCAQDNLCSVLLKTS